MEEKNDAAGDSSNPAASTNAQVPPASGAQAPNTPGGGAGAVPSAAGGAAGGGPNAPGGSGSDTGATGGPGDGNGGQAGGDATVTVPLDLSDETPAGNGAPAVEEITIDRAREGIRGDLARGLLWLLTLTIGGIMFFIGLRRVPGEVLTQSVFPSLVTLAGTALGFYFGAVSTNAKKG